jgi:hypothetical protein
VVKADCIHGAEVAQVVLVGGVVAVPRNNVEGRETLHTQQDKHRSVQRPWVFEVGQALAAGR